MDRNKKTLKRSKKRTITKQKTSSFVKIRQSATILKVLFYIPVVYYEIAKLLIGAVKRISKILLTQWQSYRIIVRDEFASVKKNYTRVLSRKINLIRRYIIKIIPTEKQIHSYKKAAYLSAKHRSLYIQKDINIFFKNLKKLGNTVIFEIPDIDLKRRKMPASVNQPYLIPEDTQVHKSIFSKIFSLEFRIRIFSFTTLLLLFFLGSIFTVSVVYLSVFEDLPSSENLNNLSPRLTTTIYDRKGNILYRVYDNEDRTLVRLDDIPVDLINATLAIEDRGFFSHQGLSIRGIVRAAKNTIFEDDLEGGSTITQQLVKNTLLTRKRTIKRKMKEAVISVELERRFSKDEILEMYLNQISYGSTAYGVKSAANKYFGKNLGELSLAESAYLAGLPASPTTYSPFGSNPDAGKIRQREVLNLMVQGNMITQKQALEAFSQKLVFKTDKEYIAAPHFVYYVVSLLEDKYGQSLVARGGLEVYTSIDLDMQKNLQDIVAKNVDSLKKLNNVSNGAVLVTDPKTGEILAMVGSADYWDEENDGNVNVTISPRQPGSSIKPLTYALAFESGFSPDDKIEDSQISFVSAGQKTYSPVNYDGRFHGTVSLASALANSYNIPAVKILNKLGVDRLIEFGELMGITTWDDPSRFGLSLTLGGGEVKMTDMAQAFGVFANLGWKVDLNPIIQIVDSSGEILEQNKCVNFNDEQPSILTRKILLNRKATAAVIEENPSDYSGFTCEGERVISEKTAYLIGNILSNNTLRSPAFGSNSALNVTKKQVAVKTGTTTNLKDNWDAGFTNNFVVVSWVGNNNGDPMKNVVSGYRGASIIWRGSIDYLIENKDVADKLEMPSSLVEVEICPLTNTLSCRGCAGIKKIYEKGTEPKSTCDPEQIRQMLEEKDKTEEEE